MVLSFTTDKWEAGHIDNADIADRCAKKQLSPIYLYMYNMCVSPRICEFSEVIHLTPTICR